MTLSLLPKELHASWKPFLNDYRHEQLRQITGQIGTGYDPAPDKVLRFLTTDLSKTQVVILGQDPYPQPGMATGRAFEVNGLTAWTDSFRQASLKNIVRLLYSTYNEIDEYEAIPRFQQIREAIKQREWRILPPHQLFAAWETQGVLLLNTCLTVKGKPGEHAAIWFDFTRDLLQFISNQRSDLNWFLWGKQAQACMPFIDYGIFYCSRHPMLCSPRYEYDFLRSECFSSTKEQVNWLGV